MSNDPTEDWADPMSEEVNDQLFAGALLLFIGACSFFVLMAWARFGTPPNALYAINGLLLALGAALRYAEVKAR